VSGQNVVVAEYDVVVGHREVLFARCVLLIRGIATGVRDASLFFAHRNANVGHMAFLFSH
jgi:hypothetical protein